MTDLQRAMLIKERLRALHDNGRGMALAEMSKIFSLPLWVVRVAIGIPEPVTPAPALTFRQKLGRIFSRR